MTEPITVVQTQGWDPRIVVCRSGTLVDVVIVITNRYVVLIDTMFNTDSGTALLDVGRPHLAGRRLLVVNTHADWDHAWGNHVFEGPAAIWPAPIIGSRRCAERLRGDEARRELAEMRARNPGVFDDVRLTPPSVLFDERLALDGGDLTLELFATPGHQPDHISVYIPEIRTLIAGDAAESPFPFVGTAESLPQLRASLARMAELEPATALYCHAPETAGPALLAANIAYFDELEARSRAALDRGAAPPVEDDQLEALVSWTFADALPPGLDASALEHTYGPAHRRAIRAMVEWLSS